MSRAGLHAGGTLHSRLTRVCCDQSGSFLSRRSNSTEQSRLPVRQRCSPAPDIGTAVLQRPAESETLDDGLFNMQPNLDETYCRGQTGPGAAAAAIKQEMAGAAVSLQGRVTSRDQDAVTLAHVSRTDGTTDCSTSTVVTVGSEERRKGVASPGCRTQAATSTPTTALLSSLQSGNPSSLQTGLDLEPPSTVSHPVEQELQQQLVQLCAEVAQYQQQRPEVEGVGKLLRKTQRELLFVRQLVGTPSGSNTTALPCQPFGGTASSEDGAVSSSAASQGVVVGLRYTSIDRCLRQHQVQGLANNLRGLQAELAVIRQAPDVVAVCRRFSSQYGRQDGEDDTTSTGYPHHFVPGGLAVEVDVVAQRGHCWVEVKSHVPFSTDSAHWLGRHGHTKGLKQQAEEQLAVAAAPCNRLRWRAPRVVFHFPAGIDPLVWAELRQMGAVVTGPGPLMSSALPPPPPPPPRVCLDVTALCALVSQVTNGPPTAPDVQRWAARILHWQECLEAEAQAPLLPELQEVLHSRQLLAPASGIAQFEDLLARFGGPRERQRWRALSPSIQVVPDCAAEACSERVERLEKLGRGVKAVLGLGDAAQATTLTANARAVQTAARQGVLLEAHLHRAVWLTGL